MRLLMLLTKTPAQLSICPGGSARVDSGNVRKSRQQSDSEPAIAHISAEDGTQYCNDEPGDRLPQCIAMDIAICNICQAIYFQKFGRFFPR